MLSPAYIADDIENAFIDFFENSKVTKILSDVVKNFNF